MLPGALRSATAKAAKESKHKLAARLSPGENNGRKRMVGLAAVYDCQPAPRTPADIITPPGKESPPGFRGQRPRASR